jgi:NAD(P)-dependent dehydrogenase (short-subunit alcohol dehydrogenase family)
MGVLTGKTVLITGALGTIGKALVMRYYEEGAVVIASDRPGERRRDFKHAWRRSALFRN